MTINRSFGFKKAYTKRIKNNPKLVKRVFERVELFIRNPQDPILKDHQLTGNQKGNRAFWITGDIRIVYYPISKSEVLFLDIGTHNQVY